MTARNGSISPRMFHSPIAHRNSPIKNMSNGFSMRAPHLPATTSFLTNVPLQTSLNLNASTLPVSTRKSPIKAETTTLKNNPEQSETPNMKRRGTIHFNDHSQFMNSIMHNSMRDISFDMQREKQKLHRFIETKEKSVKLKSEYSEKFRRELEKKE